MHVLGFVSVFAVFCAIFQYGQAYKIEACKSSIQCPFACKGHVKCEYGMCTGCNLEHLSDPASPAFKDILKNADANLEPGDPCGSECSCPHLWEQTSGGLARMSSPFRYNGICVCSTMETLFVSPELAPKIPRDGDGDSA